MSLLDFFNWCYATPVGEAIRNSAWLFPVIEAFHLVGLGVLAGSVLVVEMRLMGVGLTQQPLAQIAASAQPFLIGSLIVMFATGIPLFLSESIKAYYSFAFWVKMASLFLVLLYTFTLRRRITAAKAAYPQPGTAKMLAILSLTLWFGVAWGGRWIGFS